MNLDLVDRDSLPKMADKYYFLVGDSFGWRYFSDIENLVEPKWFSVMMCPTANGLIRLAMLDKKGVSIGRLAELLSEVTGAQVQIPSTIRFVSISAERTDAYLRTLLDMLDVPSAPVDPKDCLMLFPISWEEKRVARQRKRNLEDSTDERLQP